MNPTIRQRAAAICREHKERARDVRVNILFGDHTTEGEDPLDNDRVAEQHVMLAMAALEQAEAHFNLAAMIFDTDA